MSAQFPGSLSRAQVEAWAADVESDLRKKGPDLLRLDQHLNPLEPDQVSGADVPGRRLNLVRRVRARLEAHPGCWDAEIRR